MFDLAQMDLPIRADLVAAFREVWEQLARPGTRLSGAERVAAARIARAAREGEQVAPSTPLEEAAARLGGRPWTIRPDWIDKLAEQGLAPEVYVEIVGVVSRMTAVDTFHRALGFDLEPLPEPRPGAPRPVETKARRTRGWVPMVGPPTIPTALSAVPAENEAMEALHGAMYLTMAEMQDPDIRKTLHRTQMELVAARTSILNQCFY